MVGVDEYIRIVEANIFLTLQRNLHSQMDSHTNLQVELDFEENIWLYLRRRAPGKNQHM
jgi:hypothetical protein